MFRKRVYPPPLTSDSASDQSKVSLANYWKDLQRVLKEYKTFPSAHPIKRFIIDGKDYFDLLQQLVDHREVAFTSLSDTQKNNVQSLLSQGITIKKITDQLNEWKEIINMLEIFQSRADNLRKMGTVHKVSVDWTIDDRKYSYSNFKDRNFFFNILNTQSVFDLPEREYQFIVNFVKKGITAKQLGQSLTKYYWTVLSLYWNELKKMWNVYQNLKINYNANISSITGDFDNDANLKRLIPKQKIKWEKLDEKSQNALRILWHNDVPISQIKKRLQPWVKAEKLKLWQNLLKNKELLINLIEKHQFKNTIMLDSNNYYADLNAFVEFVTQAGNENKSFSQLTSEQKKQFLDNFFDNGLTIAKLNAGLTTYKEIKLASYWNNLTNLLSRFALLEKDYVLGELLIDGKNYFNELKTLLVAKTSSFNQIKTDINLGRLFDQGVAISKINTGLTRLENVMNQKIRLWNTLWKHQKILNTLLSKDNIIGQMVINNKNYQTIFRAFVAFAKLKNNQKPQFSALTSTEKRQLIEPFFQDEVTGEDIDALMLKLMPRIKVDTKTTIKGDRRETLAIGLGIGLGIPVLTGISGLVYWLVGKYRR